MAGEPEVVVVGAGLAGLACARRLAKARIDVVVLEASDGVGGRVRTDHVEGFLLDRGFQILLTAYPECREVLDYGALRLKAFYPGALVRWNGKLHRLSDPLRAPHHAVGALFAPVGTLGDKLAVVKVRSDVRSVTLEEIFKRPETTLVEALRAKGFSDTMIERFFRPLFAGITLDRTLETSSRMFEFVFRMLASGDNALPAAGMGAIPAQIAAALPPETVRVKTMVKEAGPRRVVLQDGSTLNAGAVVIATEGDEAARLAGGRIEAPQWFAQTTVYYDAPRAPVAEPFLVLDGEGRGPVTNVAVPSRVQASYAPPGHHLVAAVLIGDPAEHDRALDDRIRDQLESWFGSEVRSWRFLRTYRVLKALPSQRPPALEPIERPVRVEPGLYVCGDHRDTASIHGALVSGRRAAEACLEDR